MAGIRLGKNGLPHFTSRFHCGDKAGRLAVPAAILFFVTLLVPPAAGDHFVGQRGRNLQAFNVFNHAQFFGPQAVDGNIASATFGQVINAAAPCLVQLGAKFLF